MNLQPCPRHYVGKVVVSGETVLLGLHGIILSIESMMLLRTSPLLQVCGQGALTPSSSQKVTTDSRQVISILQEHSG